MFTTGELRKKAGLGPVTWTLDLWIIELYSSSSFAVDNTSRIAGLYCKLFFATSSNGVAGIDGSLLEAFDRNLLMRVFGVCGVSNNVKARSLRVCGGVSGGDLAGEVQDIPEEEPGEVEIVIRDLKLFVGERKLGTRNGELKQLSLLFSSPLLFE